MIQCINRGRDKSLPLVFVFTIFDALSELEYYVDNPNSRYESISLGTWSSVSDVDVFMSRFNRSNVYKDGDVKLSLGNYVTIKDGTYNAVWEIAGFDMESNQKAADGTTFDNGYGICLIPQTQLTKATWNDNNTLSGAYKSSTMHTTHLPGVVTKLKKILGSHIINRNVLLSSSVDSSDYYSNAYTWTTAYATLMSVGQMNGTFAAKRNKYDDGEANYKLPIFNSKDFKTGSDFWSRGVSNGSFVWYVGYDGLYTWHAGYSYGVRPLIYLR